MSPSCICISTIPSFKIFIPPCPIIAIDPEYVGDYFYTGADGATGPLESINYDTLQPDISGTRYHVSTALFCSDLIQRAYKYYECWPLSSYSGTYPYGSCPIYSADYHLPSLIDNAYNENFEFEVLSTVTAWEGAEDVPFGFMGKLMLGGESTRSYFIALRGTDNSFESELDAIVFQAPLPWGPSGAYVHSAWLSLYQSSGPSTAIQPLSLGKQINTWITENIEDIDQLYISGHSLGGSMANIVISNIVNTLPIISPNQIIGYTFGAPRTGNPKFADSTYGSTIWSLMNTEDFTAYIPIAPILPGITSFTYYSLMPNVMSFSLNWSKSSSTVTFSEAAHLNHAVGTYQLGAQTIANFHASKPSL